jgi:hypothetical protein
VKIQNKIITIPEGSYDVEVQIFEQEDRQRLYKIYRNWRNLCTDLTDIKSRSVNLPEGLSEGSFCLETGSVRLSGSINGANTSFDCFNFKGNKRIQVKACSVLPDLTSFGPRSIWDEIYFMDFYKEGRWDGTFDIYKIENNLIYNHKVNASQTLKEQQTQGKRPRFSIYKSIIQESSLLPFKECSLNQ